MDTGYSVVFHLLNRYERLKRWTTCYENNSETVGRRQVRVSADKVVS